MAGVVGEMLLAGLYSWVEDFFGVRKFVFCKRTRRDVMFRLYCMLMTSRSTFRLRARPTIVRKLVQQIQTAKVGNGTRIPGRERGEEVM